MQIYANLFKIKKNFLYFVKIEQNLQNNCKTRVNIAK